MTAPREFRIECVDGPCKGHAEQVRVLPGEPFFLSLENPSGKLFDYMAVGMMDNGSVAMKLISAGESQASPVRQFRLWINDAPVSEWTPAQSAIVAQYVGFAIERQIKRVSIEVSEPEEIRSSEQSSIIGNASEALATRPMHRFLKDHEINALLVGKF